MLYSLGSMPVNSTHPDYDENIEPWQRIRDVLAGDRAIKRAGEKYVARLDSQTDEEFQAYVERGFFYNATARTVAGYVGMIFRRDPVLQLPDSTVRPALKAFLHDVDLRGTTLDDYAKSLITDVVAIGRAGKLVDWEGSKENRPYACVYAAESILNWRQTRIDGQMKLSLVVLADQGTPEPNPEDPFVIESVPQIRVLKLVGGSGVSGGSPDTTGRLPVPPSQGNVYQVELWQAPPGKDQKTSKGWKLISTSIPLRLGKPLTSIPFVFHGPYHGRPEVAKSPVEDLVAANLDHYRLNTDYKHGMHFTALPTAFVTGFDKNAQLRIGSTTAWVSETAGAKAAYLEFKGDGLSTFERALDRSERLLAVRDFVVFRLKLVVERQVVVLAGRLFPGHCWVLRGLDEKQRLSRVLS